jgi:hypothetical protein
VILTGTAGYSRLPRFPPYGEISAPCESCSPIRRWPESRRPRVWPDLALTRLVNRMTEDAQDYLDGKA